MVPGSDSMTSTLVSLKTFVGNDHYSPWIIGFGVILGLTLIVFMHFDLKKYMSVEKDRKFTEEDAEWLRAHWKREAERRNK
ncbi:hypothetical protein [Brevibacillus reuszeri]|uniref:hypothetical protein n=1 Tax=Brevibacillus reuszeri TaxID=54915 RepID=UPI000CCBFBB5|nr:hypothetical protein [Brevibacillus reuszeri]